MDTTYLKVWLPFDESTTKDLCWNGWTAYGSPTIQDDNVISGKALQLNLNYLRSNEKITFGGSDFTISCYACINSTSHNWGGLFCAQPTTDTGNSNNAGRISFFRSNNSNNLSIQLINGNGTTVADNTVVSSNFLNARHHFELDYIHANSILKIFIDGQLSFTLNTTVEKLSRYIYIGCTGYDPNGQRMSGTIDEFQIFDGVALHTENFTPPTDEDYFQDKLAFNGSVDFEFTADVQRKVSRSRNPVLQYLSFTGNAGSYGEIPLDVLAGATIFTIEAKFSTTATYSSNNNYDWKTIIGREIQNYWQDDFGLCVNNGRLCFWAEPKTGGSNSTHNTTSSVIVNDGKIHKAAVVANADGSIDLYCDGELVAHTDNVNAKITDSYQIGIASNINNSNSRLQMDFWEARFWSVARTQEQIFADIQGDEAGLEAWYIPNGSATLVDGSINGRDATLYGSPVYSYVDTLPIDLSFDVVRLLKWRYVNPGDADDLIIASTVLTNLPESKSITGTAFYQTTRAKCFDIPATDDIWIKFDVYFDGSNRWRAYNGGSAGSCGICSYSDGDFGMWQNNNRIQDFSGICKTNQLQTVLLHMISGSSDGIIEAWVDGVKIHTYTGDVNHGSDFADIYLQSDGAGTFFSNVIISNAEIGLGEGYQSFTTDVERKLSNRVEATFDVGITDIAPITIPAIGEHFNHFVDRVKLYHSGTQKIILPKESVVYIRGYGAGAIKFFSDTNNNGFVTFGDFLTASEFYAKLDECETVFIEFSEARTTSQTVIKTLMHYLKNHGGSQLDSAIKYIMGEGYNSKNAVAYQFIDDLERSESYTDFLRDYCDIILDNEDTGAISGSDAGGSSSKTAESIVPEKKPSSQWEMPTLGSSTVINGLTVNWPSTGAGGIFTDAEKFILKGLNSEWIKQSLDLIEESLGLNFETDASPRAINIAFTNSDSSALAFTEHYERTWITVRINMAHYAKINTSSEDGALFRSNPKYYEVGYLDRTIAHELTHAVMIANIPDFGYLPAFIKEGSAELVHGIDDFRRNSIVDLLTTQKDVLLDLMQGLISSTSSYTYAAGYLFLRYLAKQGQSRLKIDIPNEIELTNLLISDGATDSDYNALTDNTRQLFYPDFLRTLIKSTEDIFDVEVLSVMYVEFLADVKRDLLTRLILFPRNSEDFFSDVNNPFLRKRALRTAPPANTEGLQNFEVTIAEQQITDQVKFTGIIPFDIMQQVKGQYFDYCYNMRVERVQQQGILYSCDCCSDIDQLLFTQMNYNIPPSTWYRKVNGEIVGESETIEIETHYPPASEHVNKIAAALGLNPVMQFDDFLSTVLMDDLGGVTYNDLIRDVFGWSSRVPTQLINVFIRDGNLFVIERGHEAHTVDITNAEKTLPIITKELVRTSWGSSVTSETEIKEVEKHYAVPVDTIIDSGGGGGDEKYCDVEVEFSSPTGYGYTTYSYNSEGLLRKTNTHIFEYEDNKNTESTVEYSYDDDGTMIKTETHTRTHDINGNASSTSTLLEKKYGILPNGEKFLASEYSATYEDGELVDWKQTTHSPSRVGQSHTTTVNDGGIAGAIGGQNTGDDRVTPFSRSKAKSLTNYINSETGEWKTSKTEKGTTIYGLSLYDSSFPIHDEDKLIQVTNAIKDLNRKTRETVSLTIYNFPHIIDFNDKVILYNSEFFLVQNTARTTPRIILEQNLTLVRWY